jgi:protein phosphatase 1D
LEFAFFGIYDGHGGQEAAKYAKEHLMNKILEQKGFYSNDDDEVLKAIKEGYIATHLAMWKNLGKSHTGTWDVKYQV